jgi:TRAP-type C4-dicarboxylate transport system permease small subunit
MKTTEKIIKWISLFFYGIATVSLVCIVILMGIRIASRNFDLGFDGLQLYAQMLSVWVVFIVAGILGIEGRHIEIDYVAERLPERIKPYHDIAVSVISLLMCVILVIGSVQAMQEFWTGTSPSVNIPLPIYYVPVVVGIGMLGLVYLSVIANAIRAVIGRQSDRFGTQEENV